VREIYRRLDAEGWIAAWLDEEQIYPGHDWNYEIIQAIGAADVIIVCLTNNSVNKEGYLQRELRMVLDQADTKPEGTLFIIPVRLEECEPPPRLRRWQYVDYFPEGHRKAAYQRLLESLRFRATRLGISTVTTQKAKPNPLDNIDLTQLDIEISASDATDEDIFRMTRQLLLELRELDVESADLTKVRHASESSTNPTVTFGSITIELMPTVLPLVLSLVLSWVTRGPGRAVKFKSQGMEFEGSPKEMDKLLRALQKSSKK
jgi:hypothetical protein